MGFARCGLFLQPTTSTMRTARAKAKTRRLQPIWILRSITLLFMLVAVGLTTANGTDRLAWPLSQEAAVVGADNLRPDLQWSFADGLFPAGWGYGEHRLVDGCLELDGNDNWAVYFLPVQHGDDFILETDVRLVADGTHEPVRAHLLTRDSNGLAHESGMTLATQPHQLGVRHRVNQTEYTLQRVASPLLAGDRAWHHLKVVVKHGCISAFVDLEPVLETTRPGPPGLYMEPHLAAENGVARFRNLRVLTLPTSTDSRGSLF